MLLLLAVHMVRIGMERSYGSVLSTVLRRAGKGRIPAAFGGAGMAIMLQSSTAVAILACEFAAMGMLPVITGIALLLGADLGSAIVVRILTFDLGWLIPVCLALGGILHLKFSARKIRETGRILLGLGFVLLSLQMVGTATEPLREGAILAPITSYLAEDYITAFLLGAVFTWVVHSSVASVLMIAAFAGQGLLSLEAGLPLVLGANFGGGLIAFWLSRGMPAKASRIPLANLLFRAGGSVAALVLMESIGMMPAIPGGHPAAMVVNFHLLFNVTLVILALPLVGGMAVLAARILPEAAPDLADEDPLRRRASALDRMVINNPRLAHASATRELLRMGELLEVMVRPVMDLFASGRIEEVRQIMAIDEDVNRAQKDIKLYLAAVNRGEMTSEEASRSIELTDFAINLEYAGDITKSLLLLAEERAEKNLRFSAEGWSELNNLHHRLLENMHLALNVLISQDHHSARELVVEKERMREFARNSYDGHLKRLQSGTKESIETSSMHLEIVRGLKEINSLLATVAYPILQRSGELLESRLSQSRHS